MAAIGTNARAVARIQAQILLHLSLKWEASCLNYYKMLWVDKFLKATKKLWQKWQDTSCHWIKTGGSWTPNRWGSGEVCVFLLEKWIFGCLHTERADEPLVIVEMKKCNCLPTLQPCQISLFIFHFSRIIVFNKTGSCFNFPVTYNGKQCCFLLSATTINPRILLLIKKCCITI